MIEQPDGVRHPKAFAPGHGTNNEAEYMACLRGLEYLAGEIAGAARITVYGDSALVINQVFGNWKVKAPNLRPFHRRACQLVVSLREREVAVVGEWVKRDKNVEADALCAQAHALAEAPPLVAPL